MTDQPPQHLFADVLARVHAVCAALALRGRLARRLDLSRVVVEPPRDATHGDMATNAAMVLAKDARHEAARSRRADRRKAARRRAGRVGRGRRARLHQPDAEAAGLGRCAAHRAARRARPTAAARSAPARKVNVEYVSANPTGPMHVGHCRGAVFGDALATCWHFAGYDVTREYYINDAGAQVDVLARSAFLRYREALGENIGEIPEGLYPGDYLMPVGAGARGRAWRQAAGDAGSRMAAARARQGHRHDDGR